MQWPWRAIWSPSGQGARPAHLPFVGKFCLPIPAPGLQVDIPAPLRGQQGRPITSEALLKPCVGLGRALGWTVRLRGCEVLQDGAGAKGIGHVLEHLGSTFSMHLAPSCQPPACLDFAVTCPQHLAFLSLIKRQPTGPLPQADALMGEVGEPLLQALCSSRKLHALSLIGPSLALVSKVWPWGPISTT